MKPIQFSLVGAGILLICLPAIQGGISSPSNVASITTASGGTITPSSGGTAVTEWYGPFASWDNVKTKYGAVGDGTTDDTVAFQAAFDGVNTGTNSPVLYIPPGIYKLTNTVHMIDKSYVAMIGADPKTTIIDWQGAGNVPMFWLDGIVLSRFARFTMRGNGALSLIEQSRDTDGRQFDTGNTYEDIVFTNAVQGLAGGFRNGDNGGFAEVSLRRCKFLDLSFAGITLGCPNSLDIWVWDSTFQNCAKGISSCETFMAGFHVFRCLFIGSTETDMKMCGKTYNTVGWNTSTGSVSFVQAVQNSSCSVLLQGNTVIDPQGTAVDVRSLGPVTLIDNVFASTNGATTPSVIVSNGAGVIVLSVSNVTTTANALKYDGGSGAANVVSVDDVQVTKASLSLSLPQMPGVATNFLNRTVFEVTGTTAAAIQAAINAAATNPTPALVHLPYKGAFSVDTTLTVPANANMWITGDSANPNLLTRGMGQSDPMWKIIGPTKVILSDIQLNLYGGLGILCTNVDQVGSRVMIWKAYLEGAKVASLKAQNLAHCRVELQDVYHEDTRVNATGTGIIVDNAQVFGYGLMAGGNYSNYWVGNGGKLLLHTSWYEDGVGNIWYAQVLDTSTVTFVSGTMANLADVGAHGFSFTNFNGLATVLNFLTCKNNITLEGDSLGTNWIANSFKWHEANSTAVFNNKSAGGTQIITGQGYHNVAENHEYPLANVGTATAAFVRTMLQQLRSDRPSALATNIASSATDITIIRMAPRAGSVNVLIKP